MSQVSQVFRFLKYYLMFFVFLHYYKKKKKGNKLYEKVKYLGHLGHWDRMRGAPDQEKASKVGDTIVKEV